MKHVVVDPITRIEGHLRVEVSVDEGSGKVTDALSSGTAWRGLELVMKDRDPRDAWAYIQRICGVCTTAHALGAVRAVEDALKIRSPRNANYIRNIMGATLTVQDHMMLWQLTLWLLPTCRIPSCRPTSCPSALRTPLRPRPMSTTIRQLRPSTSSRSRTRCRPL